MTAWLLLGVVLIVGALLAYVTRQEREIRELRRWRHDVASPALIRAEELYARTHEKVGLPSIEDVQAREARIRARSLPS